MLTLTRAESGPIDAELVVASDIHLRNLDDARGQLLLATLDRLAPSVRTLVLNGDVFDFCYGGGRYFRAKYARLAAALERCAARGLKVVLVEGNHEFHMRLAGWTSVEIVDGDYVVPLSSGESVRFMHGDLLRDDPLYRAFRRLIKSSATRFAANMVPGRALDAYALGHARASRSRDKYRTLDLEAFTADYERWITAHEGNHGIVGHFHVDYARRRADGKGLMMCVESWGQQPNLLVFRGGRWERIVVGRPEIAVLSGK
jgi:UDP-2,3-diacylglucosamine hydrolase